MSDRHHEEKTESASKRLISFLQRYRFVILILAAAAVLFPIVYYVVDAVNQRTTLEGAKTMFELDKKSGDYRAAEDGEKKTAAEKELFALIDRAADQFRGRYAGAYALLMRATINYQKLTSGDAADKKTLALSVLGDLSRAVDATDDNLLVTVALMHLATVVNNLDNLVPAETGVGTSIALDEVLKIVPRKTIGSAKPANTDDVAFAAYQHLVDRYPKSLYSSEALVAMGFLLEAKGDDKGAYDLYSRLESDYGASLWTKIAINRKIALEAGGRVTK